MGLPENWRIVKSLQVLKTQVDRAAPLRSKASDGAVADSHHSTTSSHYPHYVPSLGARPVVTARDFTHDPEHGFDSHTFARSLIASKDQRINYVISWGEIASGHAVTVGGRRYDAWQWRPYSGDDPHRNHCHVDVVNGPLADNTSPWTFFAMPGGIAVTDILPARLILEGVDPDGHGYNTDIRPVSVQEVERRLTEEIRKVAAPQVDTAALAEALAPALAEAVAAAMANLSIEVKPKV